MRMLLSVLALFAVAQAPSAQAPDAILSGSFSSPAEDADLFIYQLSSVGGVWASRQGHRADRGSTDSVFDDTFHVTRIQFGTWSVDAMGASIRLEGNAFEGVGTLSKGLDGWILFGGSYTCGSGTIGRFDFRLVACGGVTVPNKVTRGDGRHLGFLTS